MFEKVVVSEEVVFEDKALSGVKNLHNRVKVAPDMVLHWCLIDFLQLYNERKKLENKFKSLFFKDISSIDPEGYARRIILFLKGVLHIDT